MPVRPSFTWLLWGYASDWIYWIFFYIVSYTPYRVNITGSSGQLILVSALFFSTLGLCDFIHHDLDPIRPGWLHVCLSARTFDSMWFTGSQNGVKVLFFFLPEYLYVFRKPKHARLDYVVPGYGRAKVP